ncbi:PucR family transcriptional regulator [Lacticaseibacillus nasuensis]|uniref:PucR C-terminal helix-turn-helix domain-containing protein n=1 Tax=Lacticaseibacillus nasuensis JCM 17158 TaxID=1291734 RepID=A0A0R1JHZ3_9LACO|nr:helix-turn-helix domain-containing protein [Lacticaseibacillus nasuensis]KRK70895.1 hypothetical protein FD02_GL000076 [Lacticaseibacillus nasuensis JCM 17158]
MRLDQIFNEFVHVVEENPDYVIGLLDAGKIIISSNDKSMIGKPVGDDADAKSSRVYPLQVNGKLRGYLWVKSADSSIDMVSKLLYDSLSTRIQYEVNQESALERLSRDDQLIKELTKQGPSDVNYIQDLVKQLKLDSELPRVAVYLFSNDGFDRTEVTNLKYKINDRNTFYSLVDDQSLLIYKNIKPILKEESFHSGVSAFISELVDWGITNTYYAVGTPQSDLKLYGESYSSCLWLMRNVEMKKDRPYFFTDYLVSYYRTKLSREDINNLFDFYLKRMDKIDPDEMSEIANAFFANNFNLKQTADHLFLHKNTLLYKLKRYETNFGLDIRGSSQGKLMFYLIADLFSRTLAEKRQVKDK